jgi:hypothetical protein
MLVLCLESSHPGRSPLGSAGTGKETLLITRETVNFAPHASRHPTPNRIPKHQDPYYISQLNFLLIFLILFHICECKTRKNFKFQ